MLSLLVETAAVVVLAVETGRRGDRWLRSLLVWSSLVLAAHVAYTVGIFLEVYAFTELRAVVRTVAHVYGVLLAASVAAVPLLWINGSSGFRVAFAATIAVAVGFAVYNSMRLVGMLSERPLSLAATVLYALTAVWFGSVSARGALRGGSDASPVLRSTSIRAFPAVAAVAAVALALDTGLTSHRIHDGIHAGFLVRPAIYTVRSAILLGLLLRSRLELARLPGEKLRAGSSDKTDAISEFSRRHSLTPRERDILGAILAGKTAREAADELCVSHKTVNAHLYNVYRKAGVRNRSQLNREVYLGSGE
jgi:DNA-binding CsgD family transcriptional regulator